MTIESKRKIVVSTEKLQAGSFDPKPDFSTDEGIPYCHLFKPSATTGYHLDLALYVPKDKQVGSVDIPTNDFEWTSELTCCSEYDMYYYYDVHIVDDVGGTNGDKFVTFRFPEIFNGFPETCNIKVKVRVLIDNAEKGTTYIRTIDADSYGG